MKNYINNKDYYPSDTRTKKVLRIIGMVCIGLIFAVLFALVFGFFVKWLWNVLMPDLFGLKQITYWQAFGIVILAKLLFGAFGPHHRDHQTRYTHPFSKWHPRFHDSDDEPWDRRSRYWKIYKMFWRDEGKAAFEAYAKKAQRDAEEEGQNAQGDDK